MKNCRSIKRMLSLGVSFTVLSCVGDREDERIDVNDNEKDTQVNCTICGKEAERLALNLLEASEYWFDLISHSFWSVDDDYRCLYEKFFLIETLESETINFRDLDQFCKILFYSADKGDMYFALQKALDIALTEKKCSFFYFFYLHFFQHVCANYEKDKTDASILNFLYSKQEKIQKCLEEKKCRMIPGLLHIAVVSGSLDVVKYFVETKGMDVDDLDFLNRTPLHYVSDYDVAEYLISKGASIDIVNSEGDTPLQAVDPNGWLGLRKLFELKNDND